MARLQVRTTRNMNLKQLRLVREIVRSNFHVTDAASALFTSQSGVSKHIKDLEDELGIDLFERRGKRLLGLTEPGALVLEMIDRALLEVENIRQLAGSLAKERHGTLTIAATHTQSRYILPKFISEFRRAYEDVEIVLLQAHPREIPNLLLGGKTDVGFATDTLEDVPDLLTFPFYSWDHDVIVPAGHPLLKLPKASLQDVAHYPLVTYDKGLTGRKQIDSAFDKLNLTSRIVMAAIDSDVIKTYVRLGIGVGIIATMAYDPDADAGLHPVKLKTRFDASMTRIAVRRGRFLKDYAYRFIEICAPAVTKEVVSAANAAVSERDENASVAFATSIRTRSNA